MTYRRQLGRLMSATAAVLLWTQAHAATDTVLLLYTADFHDHIRPSPSGKGGLPYVSGYVKQVRAKRPDVVLVDGGDVLNKGDMLPFATKGEVMYEAMRRTGYSAGVPGNHDFCYGLPQLLRNASIAGFPVLCANVVKNDGSPVPLPQSCIVDADGVKVGIVGFTVTGFKSSQAGCRALNDSETAAILTKEAAKLDEAAHLIVAVGHYPRRKCMQLSKRAPGIDVWVAGHSHEALAKPVTAPETGALVVQAGSNAVFVGRLELTVDLDTEEIVSHQGRLVGLDHKTTPIDQEMAQWIEQEESAKCPRACEVLGKTAEDIPRHELAELYARAMREKAGTDVALVDPRFLLGGFSAGQTIDHNAVFASHRSANSQAVTAQLSGAAIQRRLNRARSAALCLGWDGFAAKMDFRQPIGQRVVETELEPERQYSVVTQTGVLAAGRGRKGKGPKGPVKPCDFTATEALAAYIKGLTAQGTEVRRLK